MEAPFTQRESENDLLPNRFRYLVQRVQLLAEEKDKMSTILFDGTPDLYQEVGWKFSSFLYRSEEGRARDRITDAPAFVDSVTSAGIQIADMVAYVIRKYQGELFDASPPAEDLYLHAIHRWYGMIMRKTVDLTTGDGEERRGIYFMPAGGL